MNGISGIMLFGSFTTKTNHKNSDLDILVIYNEDFNRKALKSSLQTKLNIDSNPIDLTCYSNNEFEQMISVGSLFVEHLKSEGKILFGEKYLKGRLSQAKSFHFYLEELLYYKQIYLDVLQENKEASKDRVFEIQLEFTISRNICILLCNYKGFKLFGKNNAFQKCIEIFMNFPINEAYYSKLESIKDFYQGNKVTLEHNEPFKSRLVHLISFAEIVLNANDFFSDQKRVFKTSNRSLFGYADRLVIEKKLFRAISKLSEIPLPGFSSQSFQFLKLQHKDNNKTLALISKVFELRKFIKDLSSSSAYINHLSIELVGQNYKEALMHINYQLTRIEELLPKG